MFVQPIILDAYACKDQCRKPIQNKNAYIYINAVVII
jgi:hypothetical protein